MDLAKTPKIVMLAIIGIILISAVAIPIFNDMNEEIKTQNNTAEIYSAANNTDVRVELSYIPVGDSNKLKINDEVYDIGDFNYKIITDSALFSLRNSEITVIENNKEAIILKASQNSSVVFENGVCTLVSDTVTEYTLNYTFIVYPDKNGDLGFFNSNFFLSNGETAYIPYFTSGGTAVGTVSLKDGVTTTVMPGLVKGSDGKYTTKEITVTPREIAVNEDNREYSSKYSVSYDGGETQDRVGILAPIKYLGTNANIDAMLSMVNIIPILLVISLLIGIVGYTVVKFKE